MYVIYGGNSRSVNTANSQYAMQLERTLPGQSVLESAPKVTGDDFLLYAVDVVSGKSERIPHADPSYPETLSYSASRDKIFALGLVFPSQARTLVALDVKTKTFSHVSTLNRFSMLLNDLSTIDEKAGVLYTYLQDTQEEAFYLIGLS